MEATWARESATITAQEHPSVANLEFNVCTGRAYVVLKRSVVAAAIVHACNPDLGGRIANFFCCRYPPRWRRGATVRVRRAPEPDDIFYENMEYSEPERFWLYLKSILVSLVAMVVCFVPIWGLTRSHAKNTARIRTDTVLTTQADSYMGYVISLVIVMLNQGVVLVVGYLTDTEKPQTRSTREIHLLMKLFIAFTLNTVVALIVAHQIGLHGKENNTELGCPLDNGSISWFCVGSIIDIAVTLSITNAVTAPLLDVIPVSQGLLSFYYSCYAMSQEEMDYVYAPPELSLAYLYASSLTNLAIAAFFAPAAPIIYLITAVGMGLLYWSQKYFVLRRGRLPHAFDARIHDEVRSYMYILVLCDLAMCYWFYFKDVSEENQTAVEAIVAVWILWMAGFALNRKLGLLGNPVGAATATTTSLSGEADDYGRWLTQQRAEEKRKLRGSLLLLMGKERDPKKKALWGEKLAELESPSKESEQRLSEVLNGTIKTYQAPTPTLLKAGVFASAPAPVVPLLGGYMSPARVQRYGMGLSNGGYAGTAGGMFVVGQDGTNLLLPAAGPVQGRERSNSSYGLGRYAGANAWLMAPATGMGQRDLQPAAGVRNPPPPPRPPHSQQHPGVQVMQPARARAAAPWP